MSSYINTVDVVDVVPKRTVFNTSSLTNKYDSCQYLEPRVEHAFHSLKFFEKKQLSTDITPEQVDDLRNLQNLDKADFIDFLMVNKIKPKVYMLKCDKDLPNVEQIA